MTCNFFYVPSGRPHPLSRLQVDPPPDEQPRRQQQDTDVRQPLAKGGLHQRDPQLTQVRQEGQPMPDRDRLQESALRSQMKKFITKTFLINHLLFRRKRVIFVSENSLLHVKMSF